MERNVSLVLVLIDDLTGKRIMENCTKVWIEWEKPPVFGKGFYVFMDIKNPHCILHMESRQYQSKVCEVSLLEKEIKVMKIRMEPSYQYPYKEDAVMVRGTGSPGETVSIASQEKSGLYRLARTYKTGETIQIRHGEQFDYSGKKAVLRNKEDTVIIQLANQSEESITEYFADILSGGKQDSEMEFQKVNTTISFLYETTVGEDGTFTRAMPGKRNSSCQILLGYKEKFQTVTIQDGRIIHLDSDIEWEQVE